MNLLKKTALLLFSRYQIGLKTLMADDYFIFDYINSLYCNCRKVNLTRGG